MSEAAAAPAPAATPAAPPVNGTNRPAPAPTAPAPEAKSAEVKPAAPVAPKTYKLKVAGQEREVSEGHLIALAQKTAAGDQYLADAKREREAAAAERQSMRERFGANWRQVLEENGQDPEDFLRRAVLERYGQAELTPEQKALQAEQQARRAAEEKLGKFEQERLTAQQQAEEMQHRNAYQGRFLEALEKSGLGADPQSPLTVWAVRHMATLEEANMDAGTDLPPDVLAEMVKEDLAAQHAKVFDGLDGDALLQRLGPDLAKRIGKALVADYEKRRAGGAAPAPAGAPEPPRAQSRPGLAQPVTVPKDPATGKFVSREERRGSERLFASFIPASVTQG